MRQISTVSKFLFDMNKSSFNGWDNTVFFISIAYRRYEKNHRDNEK